MTELLALQPSLLFEVHNLNRQRAGYITSVRQ